MNGQRPGSIFSKTLRTPAITVSLSALILSALLGACGGGGGDSTLTTPPAPVTTNYFPADTAHTWEFEGTINSIPFVNTLAFTGTTDIQGTTVDVFTESNSENKGLTINTFRLLDENGLWYYGTDNSADTLTPLLIPYREMVFPLTPGAGLVVLAKTGLDYGRDMDGDGINETCDVTISTVMDKFENLLLPAGIFTAVAKINTYTRIEVTLSKDGTLFVGEEWNSKWYAPDVGPVKRESIFITDQPGTPVASIHVIEELRSYSTLP